MIYFLCINKNIMKEFRILIYNFFKELYSYSLIHCFIIKNCMKIILEYIQNDLKKI